MNRTDPITVPFTITVDGQEKQRYWFHGLTADADKQYRPLIVPTEWSHLKTGDYSVCGLENLITIERKSLADLFGTLGNHERRERFRREHERMAQMDFACVVIEAGWDQILSGLPESGLNPKTIYRTFLSWSQRYGVPWFAMPDRCLAEITTFRLLEKYWENNRGEVVRRQAFSATAVISGGDQAARNSAPHATRNPAFVDTSVAQSSIASTSVRYAIISPARPGREPAPF